MIDDDAGRTLVEAHDSEVPEATKDISEAIGTLIAERARKKNITSVVFDRSGYHYAGKIQALADGARKGGLLF